MYPNLLGQKAYRHLTDKNMGEIIGVSRSAYTQKIKAYTQKIKSGRFTPIECITFCKYFKKPFEYLFAIENDNDDKKESDTPKQTA